MRRHELDPFPLLSGLVFLALAVTYGGEAVSAWDADTRWTLGLGLAGLGAAALTGTVAHLARGARQRRRARR